MGRALGFLEGLLALARAVVAGVDLWRELSGRSRDGEAPAGLQPAAPVPPEDSGTGS